MKRTIIFAVLAIGVLFSMASNAADWSGRVQMVYCYSDNQFDVQLQTPSNQVSYQGSTRPLRLVFTKSSLGTDRYKMLYSIAQTAFLTQDVLWVGTNQAAGVYIVANGGNCWGQDVWGISLSK